MVESRADDVINLASMVVLTERALWQALGQLDIGTVDWIVRKEYDPDHGHPALHMYIEGAKLDSGRLAVYIDNALIETDEEYAGFHSILEINSIKLSILASGTLPAYMAEEQAEGAELGQLKPPGMQPPDQIFDRLLATSAKLNSGGESVGVSPVSRKDPSVTLDTWTWIV